MIKLSYKPFDWEAPEGKLNSDVKEIGIDLAIMALLGKFPLLYGEEKKRQGSKLQSNAVAVCGIVMWLDSSPASTFTLRT